jgi:hemerythrin superfamily protein
MSYKLDYDEEIMAVLERLNEEHKQFYKKLARIRIICKRAGKLYVALSLLKAMSTEILRHAVEEEAIVARAIMVSQKTKKESKKSIDILQHHRRIKEFFDDKLPYLMDEVSEKKAREEVLRFVDDLVEHHREEEKVVFPLARKATQPSKK